MAFAGTRLLEAEHIYQEGNTAYQDIRNKVKGSTVTGAQTDTLQASVKGASEGQLQVLATAPGIDFKELESIGKDAVAWLYSPGTAIDYPVMKAQDYDYYLRHLPDGTLNANGSLFIDYNCASDFSDPLTVIYGHHMMSGSMFASLNGYKKQQYYQEHPCMYLYTKQGNYRIDLLYGCVIGAGQWREQAFMFAENINALLAYGEYHTTFESDAVYSGGDRIVALSTCSYEFDDARYVVIGILRAEN